MNVEFYREIMAKAPIAYALNELILNSNKEAIDYRILEVNHAFEVLSGMNADEIIGQSAGAIFRHLNNDIFNQVDLYRNAVGHCKSEKREIFDEKHKKWYYLYAYAIGDNYFVTVFNDITADKKNQETLMKSESRYRGLIESQTDLIVRVDHQNRFTFVNEVYCKTFGKSHDELIGQSFFPLIHPDDRDGTMQAMEKLKIAPYRCRMEQRAMTVDGWRWFLWEDSAILDDNGQIVEIQGVGKDITAEKELTHELIHSQKRLSLAQTFANTGSWEYDIESGKLIWSPECEALFGIPQGSFGGTFNDFLSKVHPDDRDFVVSSNLPITELKDGQPLNYEHRIVKPGGEVRWVKEIAGVVKDQNGKPTQIVGFVMDITEQKIAAEAIEKQSNLQQIADNINGVFWLRSADRTRMLYLSPQFEHVFGISQETIFGDPDAFMNVVFKLDKERIAKAYEVFMKTGEFEEEYRIQKPDGEIRWIVSNSFPVRNDQGEIIRYAGITNDITDRKLSELAVAGQANQLNTLIEAMPDMIFIMQRDGTILDIFGANAEKLITPAEELVGTNIKNCFEKDEYERHLKIYKHCLDNNESAIIKFDLEINGKALNFESRLKPMDDDTLLTIVRDITDELAMNRERQNEESFRQFLFENAKDGLVILNDEHRVVDANLRFAEMLGYTLEELKNLNTWDFEADHDEQDIRKNFGLKGDLSMTFESRHRRKDGTFYNAEVSIKDFEWKGSRLVLCSVRDITGRKQAEMEIKESEEKYRMLFNANNDSISIFYIDENGMPSDFVEMNEAGAKIVGYTKDELLKTNVGQIEEKVSDEVRIKRIEEIKQNGHATFETTMRHKSGEILVMEAKAILIQYKGKPAILNIARDITGRKKSEEALKASEYKFRHLINNLNAGIVIHNPDTTIRFSNPQAASLLGITQDQLDGKDTLDPDWKFLDAQGNELKPEDYPVSKVIDTKKAIKDKVYGINRPSTTDRVWVQVNAYPEFAQNGELLQAVITFIDISDIKRAEEGLNESLEFNRRLLATIPDLVIRTDLEGNIVFVNDPGTKGSLFNTKEELIGRNMLSFIHETDLQRAVENTILMFEKPLGIKEYKLQLDNGQVLDYEVNGDVVRDSDNNPVGMIYIVRNITERKQAEAALRQSKDIVENIQLGLYIYQLEDLNDDRTLRLKFANPASTAMTGLKAEHITGKTLDENFPYLRQMNVPQRYADVVRSGQMKTFEDIHYSDDRILKACYSVKAFPLPDHHVGIAFEDVTEKVTIQNEIAKSNTQLKESQEVGNIGSWEYDVLNNEIVWSDQTYRIYGETPENFKPAFDAIIDHYPGNEREQVISALSEALENKKDLNIDHRILTKSGEIRFVQQKAKLQFDDDGSPLRLIGSIIDITERKKAEEAILRGKQRLESFLEISRVITSTSDHNKIMQMIVDNAVNIMGLGSGAIYLLNDEDTIRLEATIPALSDNFPDAFRLASLKDHLHIAKAFHTGSFVLMQDSLTADLTPAEQEIVKIRGLRSTLYLPISLRQKTIGVLILSSVIGTYNFTDEEIHLLQGFASQAAHIIDNVNNFARLKKYAAELEQHIVQRKEAEELIRQNEERFRQVAETSQTVIWEINTAGIYTYVSPMAEKIWGYKPEDLVGRLSYFDLHPDEGRYDFRDETMKLLTQKKSFNDLENPIQKQDGSIIWVSSNGLPVFDEHGEHSGYRGSDQDITGRKQAEIALRESELFANTIANNTPALLYIYDLEKRKNIWVNEVHRKTFEQLNFDASNIKYDDVNDFLHPEDFLGLLEKTGQIVSPEGADNFQMEIRLKWDDKWKWMNALVTVFKRNQQGQGVQILGALFDIDDRKTAEEELRKFKTISDQANYGTAMADLSGNLIYLNEAFAKMHDRTIDECIGLKFEIFHNESQLPKARAILKNVFDIGNISAFEMDHVTKSGAVFPTLMSVSLIRDKINQPRFIAVSALDISDYKNAQTEVLKLSQVVVQSPVSILITDINGNIEYVNPRFTEISGFLPDEVIGNIPRFLKSGYHHPAVFKKLWETILAGDIWQGEILNHKKNGDELWENISISPVKAKDGTITHFITIKDDITEKKKMIEDLIKAKENAEESDKLKTSFINNINHEIRTPLNGILGFGQILTQQNLPASEKEEYYKILQDSTDRLIQTVTDYMDISMLHAGLVHLKPNTFPADELLDELKYKILKHCQAKGVELIVEKAKEPGHVMLNSDKEHLQKALVHIVTNAQKFTRKGSITIGCELTGGDIEFYVKDTGKGINPDKLNNMFNAFEQEDTSNTRGYEGSGLGLAIAKGMIDLMKGSIHIESEINKGTLVKVKIPFTGYIDKVEDIQPQVEKSEATEKPVVLIAEDIEENYFYLKVILGKAGYKTLHAENGLEAMEMCMAYPEINMVLMDIKMPIMDGIEATRRIREFRKNLPIIAVTAYAKTGDEHLIREAGCNEIIAKPINKEALLIKMAKHI